MEKERSEKSELTYRTNREIDISYSKRGILLAVFICLGPLYYGYSLTIIGATNLTLLFNYYHISLSKATTEALLNGALPVGGMLGSLLYGYLCRLTTKKGYHYYLCIATLITTTIKMIPSFSILVVCRFSLGFQSAQYMALAMNLIKDHFPEQLWKPYGALYSAMRILGVLLCYFVGNLFSDVTDSNAGNVTVFFGPAFIAAVQALTLGYFLPESPVELIRKKKYTEAEQALQYLYTEEVVQVRMDELQQKIRRSIPTQFDTIVNPLNVCGVHMAVLRQLCGITFLIVYASEIPLHQETSLGRFAVVIENAIQFAGGLVGIFCLQQFSRYYLLSITTVAALILNMALGVASILQYQAFSFTTICVFMFIIGAGLSSVAWTYPAELCTPSWEKMVGFTSMAGTALITIAPPFVVDAVPDGKAYPMFFFFGIYLFLACIINANILPHDYSQKVSLEIARKTYVS